MDATLTKIIDNLTNAIFPESDITEAENTKFDVLALDISTDFDTWFYEVVKTAVEDDKIDVYPFNSTKDVINFLNLDFKGTDELLRNDFLSSMRDEYNYFKDDVLNYDDDRDVGD